MRKSKFTDETICVAYATGESFRMIGQKTSLALGVISANETWSSVMLLSGLVLAEGFPNAAATHRFNREVAASGLPVGEVSDAAFVKRAGGVDKARAVVEKCRKKTKEKP